MSDLNEFKNQLESRIADARKEPNWTQEKSNEYMTELAPKRAHFVELAAHLIASIILPRVTLLANLFDAKPADNDPPERCSCWLHYNERFPSTTKVEFAVEHDARFEKVVITYELYMMPVFIKYNAHDRITTSLDSISDYDVSAWTEKRLLEFLDTYLQIDRGDAFHGLVLRGSYE